MIKYSKFILDNGLTVIHHADKNTQLCVINILYKVGSRDESPEKTGLAHLFEHLMFSGSTNVKDFDHELQKVGGESNAFTSNDITNYYMTLPMANIETGFWIESDRMFELKLDQKKISIQKKVVVEEFKELYLSEPYGDVWLKLLPLAYKNHPYSWPTIGKSIEQIKSITLTELDQFFKKNYSPDNAILVVAGNISLSKVKVLATKWFSSPAIKKSNPNKYSRERKQKKARVGHVYNSVPFDMILKAYHMCGRDEINFYNADILSDILGSGKASRFYNKLVRENPLFSEIDTYITGDKDPGLFIVEGTLMNGVEFEAAENAIIKELENIKNHLVEQEELKKAVNQNTTNILFGDISVLNKAMKLAFAEFLGNLQLVNDEVTNYKSVTTNSLQKNAHQIFQSYNCSTLYYHRKNESQ